ncbi:MAG: hypothetical protein K2J67_05415 [Lachnospiraceae bacterium]|nr:hypothetical protein [Lachnospiraceae bacterium]
MGNHFLDDGEESQNLKSFQEYPSFDNGILDHDILDNGILNNKISNNGILDLEPVIPDASHNHEQAMGSGTIDSRSFTHTEAEWERIQERATAVDYVDSTDSWNDYRERKTQNFFTVFLAILVSVIVAGVFVGINVMLYDIEYISTLQFLLSMLPPIALFTCFYYMTGKRAMAVVEGILLMVLNEIISYIMFHAVMAQNVQKIYPEITFMEAWDFVDIMKSVTEMQRIYYLHFAIIFGVASVMGIAYGIMGIKGLLDGERIRRNRYR